MIQIKSSGACNEERVPRVRRQSFSGKGADRGRAGILIPVVILAVLTSACSSGSRAPQQQAGPTRATTETVRAGRLTEVFDTSLPKDPAQASVVSGFRTAMVLWNRSQETSMLVSPVTSYVTGNALHQLLGALAFMKKSEVVPSGADRLFETRASVISGARATVTTCDDSSKLEEVNPDTGAVDTAYSAPADQQYILETWQLVRLRGQWAVSSVSPVTLPDARARPCQPLRMGRTRRRSAWTPSTV
jgi:hypothetical protein